MNYENTVMGIEVAAMMLIVVIIYHHFGYPILLKLISSVRRRGRADFSFLRSRDFRNCVGDSRVPSVHLYIPVYNEAAVIEQKIDSLGWIDYPTNKLTITILCDGCSDDTVAIARNAVDHFSNKDLNIRIAEFDENRGKVAMVNEAIKQCEADILAFSDASAILSADAIWRMAQHFICNPNIGVVTGNYSLLQQGTEGEGAYWQYQNRIREMESDLGSVMGAPGAFYAVRTNLCDPLEMDTINDDFILPMRVIAKGYQSLFDPELRILETEGSDEELDAKRRIRISQGNLQQILRLKRLFLPDLGWVCWMFASGKLLRVLMPYCMLALLGISAWLTPYHWFWGMIYVGQLAVYLVACLHFLDSEDWIVRSKLLNNRLVRLVSYLCVGHFMGLIGSASYLLRNSYNGVRRLFGLRVDEKRSWQKIR
ncbi:MAG: glycosyltransferase [Saccharospirillaceae bacterium]|nr:glycosyltransferase [Saccharospirillaceae bacterium]